MRFFHGRQYRPSSRGASREQHVAYFIYPDGEQEVRNSVSPVLTAMAEPSPWRKLAGKFGRLWYFDVGFPGSKRMRSRIWFGTPLRGFRNHRESRSEQRARYADFVARELYPLLRTAETDRLKVYFEGHAVTEHEVVDVVAADALLAAVSLACVWVYMALYTRAPLLALFGMVTVVTSLPLSGVLFLIAGYANFPAINFLALFLMTGIGADHLFVLTDAWRQSKHESENPRTRLQVTLRRAGRAIVACGCTTAASFLSNVCSAVRPLRWFGAFVGLCVLSNLVLCLGIYPLVLLLRETGKRNKALLQGNLAGLPPVLPPEVNSGPREAASKQDDAADLPEIVQMTSRVGLMGGGEGGLSGARGITEVAGGKAARPHERFLTNVYAPLVAHMRFRCLLTAAVLTLGSLALVVGRLEVSRQPPTFFSPGSHNLGDVQEVRSSFGNESRWSPDMELEPLRICRGCMWPARSPPSLAPMGCERLGATCEARPCAGPHGVADSQPCGHRGTCDASSGRCTCQAGFTGPDCRQARVPSASDCGALAGEEPCNGRGVCLHSMCWCNRGWWGDTCALRDGSIRDCAWSTWGQWSTCSVPCGWGHRVRRREVATPAGNIGEACSGRSMETRECKKQDCDADCVWGNWGPWSPCNVDCGDGFQERLRSMVVEARGQGAPCVGEMVEATNCSRHACSPHCNVSEWEPLGACSSTCGPGFQRQRRSVRTLAGAPQGSCAEGSTERRAPCNEGRCPSVCRYGPWEDRGSCSTSCGLGQQLQVSTPVSGARCAEQQRTVACAGLTCPSPAPIVAECAEANLGSWGPWGRCTADCGTSERQRSRSGPATCPNHLKVQVEACNMPPCSQRCETFSWMPAGSCSVSCGTGKQVQRRDFGFGPQPSGCPGEREVDCHAGIECPVDCSLGSWRWVDSCSVTCGEGVRRQVRPVVQFGAHGGAECPVEMSALRQRTLACDTGIACPVAPAPSLQLRLDGELEVGVAEQAELKRLIATYLGIAPEDVNLGSTGGLRRLEASDSLVVSVAVSSGAGVVDMERLQQAIANGEFHSRLRSGPGFDRLSHVEILRQTTPQPPSQSTSGPAPPPALPATTSRAAYGSSNLPDSEVATVSLVFGVHPTDAHGTGGELADPVYDSTFDLSLTWTQSAIERACDHVKRLGHDLAIRRARCFTDDFKVFLRTRGMVQYPVWPGRSVHILMSTFLAEHLGSDWQGHVGFSQDGTRVLWVSLSFVTDLPLRMPAEDAWAFARRWDRFVDSYKRFEADNGVGSVFHTSELWVRAETETRLVDTTLLSAAVSVIFALVAVVLFLGNLALAVFVILSIVCVVICLAALMFGIIGWTFGPVEAVGLIVFVGCSVDYTLHLAESFSQSTAETRFLRTQEALRRTGGAIFAAAVTSIFAGIPILFCTIQVFVQFGVMVIANTILSLLFSLIFFSALLMVIGPFADPCLTALASCRRQGSGCDEHRGCDEVTVGAVVGTVPGGKRSSGGDGGAPTLRSAGGYAWMTFDDDGAKKAKPHNLSDVESSSEPPLSVPGSPMTGTFSLPGSPTPMIARSEPVVVRTPSRARPGSSAGVGSPDGGLPFPPQLFGRPA